MHTVKSDSDAALVAFKCHDPPQTLKHLRSVHGPEGACTVTSPAAGVTPTSVHTHHLLRSRCKSKVQGLEKPGNVWKSSKATRTKTRCGSTGQNQNKPETQTKVA